MRLTLFKCFTNIRDYLTLFCICLIFIHICNITIVNQHITYVLKIRHLFG